jgi:hypothetical protein
MGHPLPSIYSASASLLLPSSLPSIVVACGYLDRPDLAALCIIGSVFSFIVAYVLLFPTPYFNLKLDR